MFALLWKPSTNKWTLTIKPGKAHDLEAVAASVGRGAGGAEGRKLELDHQSPSPLLCNRATSALTNPAGNRRFNFQGNGTAMS